MSHTLHTQAPLTVCGISARASNATPEKIGDLWRRFHGMGDQEIVKDRLSNRVYCVYCEYEGDFNAPFTVVIGCSVTPGSAVPEGLRPVEIPAGQYSVFPAAPPLPQGVFNAWAEAWKTPLDRLYQADFDLYGECGSVRVYVGVR